MLKKTISCLRDAGAIQAKEICKAIRAELQYIRRNLRYIGEVIVTGVELSARQIDRIVAIRKGLNSRTTILQQDSHHACQYSKPQSDFYLALVRGRITNTTELSAKHTRSLDNCYTRIEKLLLDSHNENEVIEGDIKQYYKRNSHYPERVLTDKIYRSRKNMAYCK